MPISADAVWLLCLFHFNYSLRRVIIFHYGQKTYTRWANTIEQNSKTSSLREVWRQTKSCWKQCSSLDWDAGAWAWPVLHPELTCDSGQPKSGLLWSLMSHSWPGRDRTRWRLKTIFTSVFPVFTIGNDLTRWVTPNGQSKELPTWKSRKHPFNPRKSVGTAGEGACQGSKCDLIFIWERGKQPAQDLYKLTAKQGPLASLSFCPVPLSLEATQIWASSLLLSRLSTLPHQQEIQM